MGKKLVAIGLSLSLAFTIWFPIRSNAMDGTGSGVRLLENRRCVRTARGMIEK